MGLFVSTFPLVLGSDSSGVVLKSNDPSFKTGDRVAGCARLGFEGYGPYQQYQLFDARYAIRPPSSLSYNEASTLGGGGLTAVLGLVQGIGLEVPDDVAAEVKGKSEWVVVLGGGGSVGQYGVQIGKVLGYRVVATGGKRSVELLKKLGAEEVVDYSGGDEHVFDEIKRITGGDFFGVFGELLLFLIRASSLPGS